jgi:hypothetical protein
MFTKIIFDTNCFYDNYDLDSPTLRTTLNFCFSSPDYQFVIPRIIKDEIITNFKDQIQTKFSQIKTGIKWYNRFTVRNEMFITRDDLEEDILSYEDFLDRLIDSNDIIELEYPDHDHQTIVERNSKNQKPFSGNDAGYKDTLIWLNILDHLEATNDTVIFVSKNKSDFGPNNSLHSGLLQELDNLGLERNRIQYFSSLNSFFENIIKPQLEVLDILDQIRNNEYLGFAFHVYIRQNIDTWFVENQSDIDLSYISKSFERPVIDMIDEVEMIELEDGNRIDDNKILLEYDLVARANCDILIDRHNPPTNPLAEAINNFNFEFNASYMEGEIILTLAAKLLIFFNPIENEVISTQLENFIAQDYT